MKLHYLCLMLVALSLSPQRALAQDEYYVATNGNDQDNPGTIDLPFATVQKAIDAAKAGTTIYVRGGTYQHNTGPSAAKAIVISGKSGTSANPIRLFAYPGEEVILDFSKMAYLGDTQIFGMWVEDADWWHIKDLHLANVPAPPNQSVDGKTGNGFGAKNVNNCTFELLRAHDNHGTGIRLYGVSTNNLFLNCDAYRNIDDQHYEQPGQNADGIALAFLPSTAIGNVVRGCRAWWNGDDGIDLWQSEAALTIETSWFFWNGYYPGTTKAAGNGNGMKLGVNDEGPRHVLHHNLVFENRAKGIDDNWATGAQDWFNNTAYANGDASFANAIGGIAHQLRNNIQIGPANELHGAVDDQYNSWNAAAGVIADKADFLSVDSTGVDGPRLTDGSLPKTDFLKLVPGSDLIDAGVDVGLVFRGKAPDLGAYEEGCDVGFADCIGPLKSDCETNTLSDADHCGSCDAPCVAGQTCASGSCQDDCLANEEMCSGTCTDLDTDADHCGSCTVQCAAQEVCVSGNCVDECAGDACAGAIDAGVDGGADAVDSGIDGDIDAGVGSGIDVGPTTSSGGCDYRAGGSSTHQQGAFGLLLLLLALLALAWMRTGRQ